MKKILVLFLIILLGSSVCFGRQPLRNLFSIHEINERELNKLSSPEYLFRGEIEGDFGEKNLPTDMDLKLKSGAQVMFIKNNSEKGWVNGDMGKIVELTNDLIRVEFFKFLHGI